ncbi:MAG: septal ring lytic transglycosylase RlpA family protein [Alphaproteobacteria bacterium]
MAGTITGRRIAWLGAAFGATMLSGCAETQLLSHTVKAIETPPKPSQSAKSTDQQPKIQGGYKIGKPYQIENVWYYPAEDYDYDETGIASWYGTEFHGRPTANGEIFDMNDISAAHRTLPMPSLVRVTNLDNGRSMLVRINDRGPFARGRIIDLSRRAAQLLGMDRAGTAKVRVQILADDSRQLAAIARNRTSGQQDMKVAAAPPGNVTVETLPPAGASAANSPTTPPQPAQGAIQVASLAEPQISQEVSTVPVRPANIFVQAGAFSNPTNAHRLSTALSNIAPAKVERANVGKTVFYRVRVGPAASVEEADRILDRVTAAGYPEARMIVE